MASEHDDEGVALAVLADENARLRAELLASQRVTYRRVAVAFASIGMIALLGALVVASQRDVLLVIGAIGLFAAMMTILVTPERYIATSVAADVYRSLALSWEALIESLGLSSERYYLAGPAGEQRVFVPSEPIRGFTDGEGLLPAAEDLSSVIVTAETGPQGLTTQPTGAPLLRAIPSPNPLFEMTDTHRVIDLVCEALKEQFELVDTIEPTLDRDEGWCIVHVSGSTFGPVDRFDHPVPSLIGCACSENVNRPVRVRVEPSADVADWRIICEWAETA